MTTSAAPMPPRTLRIHLIRHGESEGNVDVKAYAKYGDANIKLTQNGIQQAEAAGIFLAQTIDDKNPNAKIMLWSSHYMRAQQTIQLIVKQLCQAGLILKHDLFDNSYSTKPYLFEQSAGIFNGLTDEERLARDADFFAAAKIAKQNFTYHLLRPPEGESQQDVYDRCLPILTEIQQAYAAGVTDLIIGSHGATQRMLVKMLLGQNDQESGREPTAGNCDIRVLDLSPGKAADCGYSYKKGEAQPLFPASARSSTVLPKPALA